MVSGPNLSPSRIDALSHWGQVAFAARCALRILPAARPEPEPHEGAIDGFRAAQVCCFLPMHAALSGGGRYRGLANPASEVVMARSGTGAARLANQCLAVAAQIAAAENIAEHHLFASLIAFYHDISGTHRVYEVFDAAADADLADLEGYRLEGMAPIPAAFFSRPLFGPDPGVPRDWQPVVTEWSAVLGMVGLSSLYELYLQLCAGTAPSLDIVAAIVEAWAVGLPAGEANRAADAADAVDVVDVVDVAAAPPAPSDAPSAPTERPPLFMLADRPLEDRFDERDLLEFKDYAQSLAVILDSVVDTPFTMSINAPWGAGKTSLANMLAARLRQLPLDRGDAPHLIFTFNAWMHDDAPNLATALISEVSRQADRHRPWFQRIAQPLPAALLEPSVRRWRRALYFVVSIVLPVLVFWQVSEHLKHADARNRYEARLRQTYQETRTTTTDAGAAVTSNSTARATNVTEEVPPRGTPPQLDAVDVVLRSVQDRMVLLGTFLTALAGLFGVGVKVLSSTSLLSFVQSPEKAAETGAIQAAQRQLKRLIAQATARGNRFIVFVDDIERCKPPRAVDVLDAVNQLLDHRNVIVVLLGDMASVAAAAQLKYKDLAEIYVPSADYVVSALDRRKELFGRLYIQKIVQYQFDLPALPRHKIQEYVTKLLGTTDTKGDGDAGPAA